MNPADKAAQLVQELNSFAEEKYNSKQYVEAEERYRAALDVYKSWVRESSSAHTAVLTTITGLVKALEAQGRRHEAASFLRSEESTISEIINMLKSNVV